jgi:signal transduction histidine kinase
VAIYGLQSTSPGSFSERFQARAHELARRAGLRLTLTVPDEIEATDQVEHDVMSIVQEAISNAARHAGAQALEVSLRACGDRMSLRISDDGCGFESVSVAHSRTGGFGLRSMQERAWALGGDLKLESTPGQGTTVELEVVWAQRAL